MWLQKRVGLLWLHQFLTINASVLLGVILQAAVTVLASIKPNLPQDAATQSAYAAIIAELNILIDSAGWKIFIFDELELNFVFHWKLNARRVFLAIFFLVPLIGRWHKLTFTVPWMENALKDWRRIITAYYSLHCLMLHLVVVVVMTMDQSHHQQPQ